MGKGCRALGCTAGSLARAGRDLLPLLRGSTTPGSRVLGEPRFPDAVYPQTPLSKGIFRANTVFHVHVQVKAILKSRNKQCTVGYIYCGRMVMLWDMCEWKYSCGLVLGSTLGPPINPVTENNRRGSGVDTGQDLV